MSDYYCWKTVWEQGILQIMWNSIFWLSLLNYNYTFPPLPLFLLYLGSTLHGLLHNFLTIFFFSPLELFHQKALFISALIIDTFLALKPDKDNLTELQLCV